jgi:3'(2'), 5'-bisphosphate nucleotidase
MNKIDIDYIIKTVELASTEIMKIYNHFNVIEYKYKNDSTPLTIADKLSNDMIINRLLKFNIPILSEESKFIPYEERKNWQYYWLLDPLDGTKEFINKNGEFTINLALMFINKPIWGIVSAPFFNKTYYINSKNQVILKDNGKSRVLKPKSKFIDNELTAVVSRSHLDTKTKLKLQKNNITKIILSGSSLKFMMIVERKANIYYRLAPTMEWDTAASHAILKNLNYNIYKEDENSEIEYNKKNLLNPNFISF